MQITQIRLHQTYAQIGLRTTQPVQEIHQQPADLSIEQVPAQMSIDHQPSRLEIDQEQARYNLGMKNLNVLNDDAAASARQDLFDALGEIAQEGDEMAAIQHHENAFAKIAADKAFRKTTGNHTPNIPVSDLVQIHYTPGEVHINWQPGTVKINVTEHKPILNYTPGHTEVYLRQMQQLQIDYVGVNVNSTT